MGKGHNVPYVEYAKLTGIVNNQGHLLQSFVGMSPWARLGWLLFGGRFLLTSGRLTNKGSLLLVGIILLVVGAMVGVHFGVHLYR